MIQILSLSLGFSFTLRVSVFVYKLLSNTVSASASAAYADMDMSEPYMGGAVEGDAKDGVTGDGEGWNRRGNKGKTNNI